MMLTSFLAAGVLALQTSAFLIPLEVSQDAGIAQADTALKHRTVELDCPACPFAGAGGDGSIWTEENGRTTVHLEFDITDDDHFLHINGQPVFPPPKTLIPVALTAAQIRTSDQSTTEPLRLGYALEVSQTKSDVTDITLHPIQLTILDLNGVAVKVDTVKLDVIQSWGKLHIARITRIPYAQSPGAGICTTSLCRLRAIIATRLRQMIDAARTHAGNAKTWIKNGCSGRKHAPGNVQQDQQNPPHHGHGHHGQGRLRRFFQKTVHFSGQVIHFFILPALFGVAGGLVACALGMLVGQAVASCMNRRSRRAGAGVAALTADGEIAISDEEKDVLVENGEMPPQYEDVDVVVVEEK